MTAVAAVERPSVPGRVKFELPKELEASVPPEARGITRDAVRLMVVYKSEQRLVHANFSDIPRFLDAGDLVVINTSATLAAEVDGVSPDGVALQVHLSTQLPANLWVVELRRDGGPFRNASPGSTVQLPEGGHVELLSPYERSNGRLWVASLQLPQPLLTYLAVHGRPIRYGYVHGSWPISVYQNVYATEPGSAEMPSAGRPFTPEVVTRLVAKGVGVAPLVLHTGVSSLESHEAPYAEYFRVDSHTSHLVNDTHRLGRRVIAIGTTVVRGVETVADERGASPSG